MLGFIAPACKFSRIVSIPVLHLRHHICVREHRIIADSQSCLFGRSFLGIDQYDSIGSRITIQSCRRRTGQHIDTFNIIRVKIRYSVRTALGGKRTFTLTKAYIEHRNTVNYIKSIIIFRNGLGTAHHDSRSRTNSTG